MADNILVDGKPLHAFRVIDLKEELKKRGIKATGTKAHLQELLKSAILSAQEVNEFDDNNKPLEEEKTEQESQDNSNESSDNNSAPEDKKIASVSINEANETIKLTIRNSPRKSEPVLAEKTESETESSSQSETDSSNGSPKNQNDSIYDTNDDGNSTSDSIVNESSKNDTITQGENMRGDTLPPSLINSSGDSNHIEQNKRNSNVAKTNSISTYKEESILKAKQAETEETITLTVDEASEFQEDFSKSNDSPAKNTTDHFERSNSKSTEITVPMSLQKSVSEPIASEKTIPKSPAVDNDQKSEAVPDDESKSKPSFRNRMLSHSKSITEDDPSKPVQKKRRWGSSHIESDLNKGISSDKLLQLINESAQVIENEDSSVKVSKDDLVVEVQLSDQQELINTEPDPKEDKTVLDSSISNIDEKLNKSSNKEDIKPSETSEASENVPRPLTPAKNPESTVLFVTGLVRPYTIGQLQKLLNSIAPIDTEKFWIDKIKSKCYAVYPTMEDAIKTRESLHNLKWPQSSPKNLSVEFATLEDIDRCLNPQNYDDLPSLPLKANEVKENAHKIEKKEAAIEISKGKYDIILNEPIRDKALSKGEKDNDSNRNIREWDRNKVNISNRKENVEENRKRPRTSPPPTPDKKEKIRERSKSPDLKRRKNEEKTLRESNKKSESPAKMLEDLFRKTKATPYIYWLPLTDEQVVEKEKQRALLEKEREGRRDIRRENSPPNRPPFAGKPFQNFPRPKFQESRRRSPPSPPRGRKRSLSPSPRKFSRYSRSPDQRRFQRGRR